MNVLVSMRAQPNLDQTLIALADPTRRAILHRLSQGEARVTELAEPFEMSLNSVSKHIRMLERAQLVRRRRSGREHLLTFNAKPLDAAAQWIETHRALWTARLQALDELLQAEDRAAAAKPTRKGRSR
jgi:DNA-binding transcriptional ArsR family regulator